MTVSILLDDELVQDFLKTATLRDAAIFGLFQSANLDNSITQPESQCAEYLPFAQKFLKSIGRREDVTQAGIALWIAYEFDRQVLDPRVQELAEGILEILNK